MLFLVKKKTAMIEFKKVEISEDGLDISIDIKQEEYATQAGYYIKKIYVEYFKNRNADGTPSALAGIAFSATDKSTTEYTGDFNISTMQEHDPMLTTFSGGMFYIIVECASAEDEEETIYDTGAVIDWNEFYRIGMMVVANYASKCCEVKCEIPDDLEQFVLVWHSLELAMETLDMGMMELLWSRYVAFGHSNTKSSCNCCR